MALAGAHIGTSGNRAQNVRARLLHGLGQRQAQRQVAGNGRRQRATRAVAVVRGNARRLQAQATATGHTLGAAGGVEAVLSLLALRDGLMPGGLNLRERDPALRVAYLGENRRAALQRVLSNSFGFGGSNTSLVLGGAQ